jgi:hypothetical protein
VLWGAHALGYPTAASRTHTPAQQLLVQQCCRECTAWRDVSAHQGSDLSVTERRCGSCREAQQLNCLIVEARFTALRALQLNFSSAKSRFGAFQSWPTEHAVCDAGASAGLLGCISVASTQLFVCLDTCKCVIVAALCGAQNRTVQAHAHTPSPDGVKSQHTAQLHRATL